MKTLDECKKTIATDFAYPSWTALVSDFGVLPPHGVDYVIDKLVNMYADEVYLDASIEAQKDAYKGKQNG